MKKSAGPASHTNNMCSFGMLRMHTFRYVFARASNCPNGSCLRNVSHCLVVVAMPHTCFERTNAWIGPDNSLQKHVTQAQPWLTQYAQFLIQMWNNTPHARGLSQKQNNPMIKGASSTFPPPHAQHRPQQCRKHHPEAQDCQNQRQQRLYSQRSGLRVPSNLLPHLVVLCRLDWGLRSGVRQCKASVIFLRDMSPRR